MNLVTFIQEHKSTMAAAGMAAVHFAHLAWPRVVDVFVYCRDNGGIRGILREFFDGKPKPN